MQFTDLVDLPVEVTQLTPLVYGGENSDTLGAAISFKTTVDEDLISFNSGPSQAGFWGEDDEVTELARIMAGKAYELDDLNMALTVYTSNGDPFFTTGQCHKVKVGTATPKPKRQVEFKFSMSLYAEPGDLDKIHKLMTLDGLKLSTEG